MICPECHAEVSDDATRCPVCGAELGDGYDVSPHAPFIFCDGCGARLSAHDRTCPKCGRPAPGILSTEAAARDLAAGKTASFPKLGAVHHGESAQHPASAARVLESSLDPMATSMLSREDIDSAQGGASRVSRPRRRVPGKLIAAAVIILALAASIGFVALDPMGIMPGVYASIERSAAEMFPSREGMGDVASDEAAAEESGEKETPSAADEPVEVSDDSVLTDDTAYDVLIGYYEAIGDYQEPLAEVIDDYNGYFIANDLARRQEASKSAYALRDEVQRTIDELDAVRLAHDSVYATDLEHLKDLALWMYNRVDVLCQSWDISLTIPEGESPSEHQSEISKPLRDALDASGHNQNLVLFEDHYYEWRPVEQS